MPSANPATSPLASCVGVFETANAVPLVPSETTTSPGWASTPIAAAALSPVPAAIGIPLVVFIAKVFGSTILGKVISCLLPIANWKISSRYLLLTLSKYPVPLASPRSVNKSAIDSLPDIFQEIQS